MLPTKMKQSLLTMAINEAPTVRRNKAIAIEKQQQHKQDLLKRMKLLKAESLYINALAYIEVFHSPAGLKTKIDALQEFSKLKSITVKLDAVKEQIKICVLGFGWTDLHVAWSLNGNHQLPEYLLNYLTDKLIPAQSTRGVPETPKITLPSREKKIPKLGTRTTDIAVLDNKQKDQLDAFVIAAVAKRLN